MGIMANVNQNLDEETAVLLGMELGVNVAVKKVEEQEEEEEICDRIENTPKKGGKTAPLDVGKIKALYKANWKAKEIAEEMRCAESAVYRHLKAMRENGEIE